MVNYIKVMIHFNVTTTGDTKLENTKVTQTATSCSYQIEEYKLTG